MKMLLLGGSGRLGSAMRRLWTTHTIVAPEENAANLMDETEVDALISQHAPDLIINCAAYNNVDAAEGEGRDIAFRVNSELPAVLAARAAKNNVRFIHFSSDYVFDGTKIDGYSEDDAPNPISVYGESKAEGERRVLNAHPGAYLIRTSRLYGQIGEAQYAKRSFVELILDDAKEHEEFQVNGKEVSSPTLVDDLVTHIETHLFTWPTPGIYHMANTGGATWFEWAQEILRLSNLPNKITPRDPATMNRAARRPEYSMLVSTKLPPMRHWKEALKHFLCPPQTS